MTYIWRKIRKAFTVFTSYYECKLDDKGRLMLPGKLKAELQPMMHDGFILKRSVFSPCLELWPMKEWENKLKKINELTRFDRKNARVIRSFLSGVRNVVIDNAGRLNIPNELLAYAGLKKDVVIASQISIIEIWDKQRYEREVEVVNDEEFAQLVEEVLGGLESDHKDDNS